MLFVFNCLIIKAQLIREQQRLREQEEERLRKEEEERIRKEEEAERQREEKVSNSGSEHCSCLWFWCSSLSWPSGLSFCLHPKGRVIGLDI